MVHIVITRTWRQRQEDPEQEAYLGYTEKPCLQKAFYPKCSLACTYYFDSSFLL